MQQTTEPTTLERAPSAHEPSNGGPPLPPPSDGRGVRLAALLVVILASCAIVGFGVLPRAKQQSEQRAEAQAHDSEANLVTIVSGHFSSDADLSLPGNIQAITDTPIYARAGGYVIKRFVDIGSKVKAGQLLAIIQAPDMDQQTIQAHADTAKAVATTEQSRSDVQRLEAMYAQSRSDVERAQAGVRQAQAALADSRSKVAQAKASKSGFDAKLAAAEQAVDSQKSALVQADAQLELADETAKRYSTLLDQGFVARQDYDQAETTFKTAAAADKAAKSAVKTAEANVESARQDINAAVATVAAADADVVSSQENVKAAVSAHTSAQEAARAAKSAIESGRSVVTANMAGVGSQEANERRYRILSGFEKVVAPFEGVITARNVDVGTLVNAGGGVALESPTSTVPVDGLFGISQIDNVRIQVNVPQANLAAILPGAKAVVEVRELPGRVFDGVVTRAAGALDSSSRARLTEVRLDNPKDVLMPGMYAQVTFSSASIRSLRVPADAVLYDAKGTRVVILRPNGKIHFQPVKIGRDFGKEIEVVSGLRGDERLVNTPSDGLEEGVSAEPIAPKLEDAASGAATHGHKADGAK